MKSLSSQVEFPTITYLTSTDISQAQLELNEWLQHYVNEKFERITKGKSGSSLKKFMKNVDLNGTVRKTGFIYDLFERNCQHYARYLLTNILRRNWRDPKREGQPWDANNWRTRPLRRFNEPRNETWRLIKRNVGPVMILIFSLLVFPI